MLSFWISPAGFPKTELIPHVSVMKKQNEEQNGEAVFIEMACGMLLQIVLLLHTEGLSNTTTRVVGISHCEGREFNYQGFGLCHLLPWK